MKAKYFVTLMYGGNYIIELSYDEIEKDFILRKLELDVAKHEIRSITKIEDAPSVEYNLIPKP